MKDVHIIVYMFGEIIKNFGCEWKKYFFEKVSPKKISPPLQKRALFGGKKVKKKRSFLFFLMILPFLIIILGITFLSAKRTRFFRVPRSKSLKRTRFLSLINFYIYIKNHGVKVLLLFM